MGTSATCQQWKIQGSKGPKVPQFPCTSAKTAANYKCRSCVRQHVARIAQVQPSGFSPVAVKSMRQTTSWPLSAKSHLQYFTNSEKTTTNMRKTLRPIPYPPGSEARRRAIAWSVEYNGATFRLAVRQITAINLRCKNTPMRGERCGARTRRGTACMGKALCNGRCRLHGGLSTGPKTIAGKARSAANLAKTTG